jgi:hypothetical protein
MAVAIELRIGEGITTTDATQPAAIVVMMIIAVFDIYVIRVIVTGRTDNE